MHRNGNFIEAAARRYCVRTEYCNMKIENLQWCQVSVSRCGNVPLIVASFLAGLVHGNSEAMANQWRAKGHEAEGAHHQPDPLASLSNSMEVQYSKRRVLDSIPFISLNNTI